MKGQGRLLLAGLLVIHLDGAIGSRDGGQSRHGRKLRSKVNGFDNDKKEGISSNQIGITSSATRHLDQMDDVFAIWEDDQGYGKDIYDDIFVVNEDIQYAGNPAGDDFFEARGWDYSWDNNVDATVAAATPDVTVNGPDVTVSAPTPRYDDMYTGGGTTNVYIEQSDGYYPAYHQGNNYYKVGKNTESYYKGRTYYKGKSKKGYSYKGHKGGKSGKISYKYKKGKSVKKSQYKYPVDMKVDKGHGGYYNNGPGPGPILAPPPPEQVPQQRQHDDYVGYDDLFHHPGAVVHSNYGNYFSNTPGSSNGVDDMYFGTTREGPTTRSSLTSRNGHTGGNPQMNPVSNQPGSQYYNDDDDFFSHDDALVIFLPRPVVVVSGNVFSQNPNENIRPVVPDNSGNSLTVGTEYLYSEILTDSNNIYSQFIPISVDNENVNFNVALDGYCTRIGPPDQNSVQGYCFFTYTFLDPRTGQISGSFTAQGIIVNAEAPGQLTVSGGTGIMTGAVGLVEILPAAIQENTNPPLLIQPPVATDPFNEVAGWAHFFEIVVDILFFLPELYAPPSRPT